MFSQLHQVITQANKRPLSKECQYNNCEATQNGKNESRNQAAAVVSHQILHFGVSKGYLSQHSSSLLK